MLTPCLCHLIGSLQQKRQPICYDTIVQPKTISEHLQSIHGPVQMDSDLHSSAVSRTKHWKSEAEGICLMLGRACSASTVYDMILVCLLRTADRIRSAMADASMPEPEPGRLAERGCRPTVTGSQKPVKGRASSNLELRAFSSRSEQGVHQEFK